MKTSVRKNPTLRDVAVTLGDVAKVVVKIAKDVSVLKDDVSVLKDDVSVLKADVSVLKTDMVGVKRQLDKVTTTLVEHGERMDTFATKQDLKEVKDEMLDHIDGFIGNQKKFDAELTAMQAANDRRSRR